MVGQMAKVNVLGAGSWGTALSLLLHKNGHQVKLWSALENEVKMLNEKREHESNFREYEFRKKWKLRQILRDVCGMLM